MGLRRFMRPANVWMTYAAIALIALGITAWPARAEEPWQVLPPTPKLPEGTQGHIAEIRGARIWYAEWSQRATGIPVLLLHGGFGNSNYFGNLVPFLVKKGYRVIAMDSPGHGRSTRANEPLTYHLMAEDVIGLLDVLNIHHASLVGWSDGGIIGFDLAINHPGRLASLFAFGANSVISGEIDGGDQSPVFAAYRARVQGEYRDLSPTPGQFASFESAMNTMWNTLPDYTTQQLRSIRVPTTIADGEHDEVVKIEHTKYLATTIHGARLVILPNVSHFAMLQNPVAFNAAVLESLPHH